MAAKHFDVILAKPRGFCAGVERAIEIVEKAIEIYGPPVYVRHEIVHNKRVVECLRKKGARFVEELDEIPDGATTIFSAHGVSEAIEDDAKKRGLPIIDATCPLVLKVHNQGRRQVAAGRDVILIGHKGHPEVEGTMGRVPGKVHLVTSEADVADIVARDPEKLAYVTQTTLSVDETRGVIDALKARFPSIAGPELKDICYATQHRQSAVRELAQKVDMLIVVGARNSSNSSRLREIAAQVGVAAHQIDDATDINEAWLEGVQTIGITAGASAPEELIHEVITRLEESRPVSVKEMDGEEENIQFKLPSILTTSAAKGV